MDRRDVFKVIAASAVTASAPAADYKPRALSDREFALLDAFCETLLPKDEKSGGATDAGVARYIDTLIFHSPGTRKQFRDGLAGLMDFLDLDAAGRRSRMEQLLRNEQRPATEQDRFVVRLKIMAIEAYANSEIGLKHFGYRGNAGRLDFPGCTDREHDGGSTGR